MHHTCTNVTARNELVPYPRLYRVIPLILWLALCLVSGKAAAQQYTADFTAAPTLIDYPGVPSWKQTAEVTLGGTVYQVSNGGNGGWQHMTTGGNGNSGSIFYSTAATVSVTIKRKDNAPFIFNGAWLRYTNSTNAAFYPPPYLTVTYVGAIPATSTETYADNTTIVLSKNVTVSHVIFSFSGLFDLYFDDLIVSAAAPTLATVGTNVINQFSNTTALVGGSVTQDGNTTVTERGIVYNTTGTPTLADTKVAIGTGTGTYSQTISGLTSGLTHYVRAYATNSVGTAYGNVSQFATAGPFTLAQAHNFNSNWVNTSNQPSPFTKYVEGWDVTATSTAGSNASVLRAATTGINSPLEGVASLRAAVATAAADLLSMGLKVSTGEAFDLQSFRLRYNTRTAGTSFGTITVTGYKAGVPVAGAVTSLTGLMPSTTNAGYATFDLSANNSFNDIDEFRITAADSPNAARLLNVDIDVVTVQNPSAAATAPTVTASAASAVTSSSALLGGEVTAAGSTAVTERGIVYNTTGTPTTADVKVAVGSGTGTFSQAVTGLTANTTYYARAYAINGAGTSYSATTITFTTTKQDQTITFNALPAKTFGDAAFGLTASASSGLAVAYASSNLAVATISGSTVTVVGAGSTTITATQTGNAQYNAAPAIPQVLLVRAVPVLAAIGSKTGNELAALAFTASATDADAPAGTLTYALANAATGTYPTGAAIDAATGAFSWTPTEAQGPGVYRVKVVVSDGTLTDEEEIELTVGEVNAAPVLAAIGNRTTTQLATVAFTASAADADAPANALTYSLANPATGTYPTGAAITAAGTFSWTPAAAQVGVFRVKVVVTDNGTPAGSDEEEIQITVGDTQRPTLLTKNITATLSAGGAVSVVPADADGGSTDNGGAFTLRFAVYGEVAEGGTLTLTAPAGAVFDGVVFASYGTATGTNGNYATGGCHAPGTKALVENALLGRNTGSISATNGLFGDPCGGTFKKLVVVATYTTAAANRIDYNCTDAGSRGVTLLGLDAAGNYAVAPAAVTVTDAQSPFLTVAADITTVNDEASAGAVVTYAAPVAADNCAGFTLTQTAGLPSGATFPAGVTTNTFRVSDASGNVTTKSFTVTVNTINRAPVLAAVGSKSGDENAPLSFTVAGADTDVPANTLSYSLAAPAAGVFPAGAAIDAATGAFTWTPTEAQGGTVYRAKVVVTDNGTPALTDEEEIQITVGEVNVVPVLASIGSKTVDEMTVLSFTASAADADLPANALTYSLATPATGTFPAGATVDANTGQFAWTPGELQGPGVYRVKVLVSDGALTDEEEIELTVNEVNQAPVLAAIGAKTVAEGALLTFTANATDADVPASGVQYSLGGVVPAGATIDAATGAFTWTPTETQGPHAYTFTVVASDGTLTDEEEITVTVSEVNVAPVLAAIGNQSVDEGTMLTFTASATDDDRPADAVPIFIPLEATSQLPNVLTFSLSGTVPAGAAINASTGEFTWTPAEAQGPGSYTFTVAVSDGSLTDEEEITVTVGEVNLAPVLASVGNQVVDEVTTLSFTASAVDVDLPANPLTYALTGTVPAGASIDASTGAFAWTPTETQGPGSYTFTVAVSDGTLTDEEEITVTVDEVNLAPVLTLIGGKTVDELTELSFAASATDDDLPANALSYSLAAPASGTYPTGAVITAAGGFSWTPTETQGPGAYRVKVVVSDGTLTDEEEIELAVNEVNLAPAFTSQPVLSVVEDTPYAYPVMAADGDSPANVLTLAAPGLPAWLTFDPATGVLSGTPENAQVGVHPIVLTVTDGMRTVEQTFSLEVRNHNDAPVIAVGSAVVNNLTVAEDQPLSVSFEVGDVDSPLSALQVRAASSNAALVPVSAISFAGTGNTRTVRFTPLPDTFGGPLTLTLEVSDGELTASTSFQVTVLPVNDAPTVHPVAEVELRINSPAQALTLTGISAGPANESDQQLALSVQSDDLVMIPAADIVYHGDGTATLRFTPAQSQTLTGPATLTVTIRDNGGRERDGEDTRQLIIPVRFLPTNNAVFMPNLFTPNGDLSNDRLTVMGEGIERITFRIFDKKGTMVYEARDVQEATTRGWDGTYRGETLPAGVYTWQIVGAFLDGSSLHYQGKKAGSVLLSR